MIGSKPPGYPPVNGPCRGAVFALLIMTGLTCAFLTLFYALLYFVCR